MRVLHAGIGRDGTRSSCKRSHHPRSRRSKIFLAATPAAARAIDPSFTAFGHWLGRLRCRRGQDPEMPDGSILPCPTSKLHSPESTSITASVLGSVRALHFKGGGREWYRPATLEDVHQLKKKLVGTVGREQVKLCLRQYSLGCACTRKRSRRILHRHLRHRRPGPDRGAGNGTSDRGRGADSATDGLCH